MRNVDDEVIQSEDSGNVNGTNPEQATSNNEKILIDTQATLLNFQFSIAQIPLSPTSSHFSPNGNCQVVSDDELSCSPPTLGIRRKVPKPKLQHCLKIQIEKENKTFK